MPNFASQDADLFFERNRQNLTEPRDDIALPLLRMYGIEPKKVLDVGCANGYRLAAVCEAFGCEWSLGIDVSEEAIRDGQARWPDLWLKRGSIDRITTWKNEKWDLVLAIFVFHWIDRSLLSRSIAEIGRFLSPGGYLLLADFAPDHPEAVPYKHREGLYTYKQPYWAIFTMLGYRLVAYLEFDHDTRELRPNVPSKDRAFKALLRKQSAD